MTDKTQGRPGFHALMMAAAYAEEGLCEHAREILRQGARERCEPRPGQRAGHRAWRHLGAGRTAGGTA